MFGVFLRIFYSVNKKTSSFEEKKREKIRKSFYTNSIIKIESYFRQRKLCKSGERYDPWVIVFLNLTFAKYIIFISDVFTEYE